MQDIPDVDNLLATARESILQYILPAVPNEQRLEALMIANALAIVRRAVAAGEAPLHAELDGLSGIYDVAPPPGISGRALTEAVQELSARLAKDIRNGVFDPPGEKRHSVQDFLRCCTVEQLRESNPKMLKAEGIE